MVHAATSAVDCVTTLSGATPALSASLGDADSSDSDNSPEEYPVATPSTAVTSCSNTRFDAYRSPLPVTVSPSSSSNSLRMASSVACSPAPLNVVGRLSTSSSPLSAAASSESPRTVTTFSFSIRGLNRSPTEDITPKIEELEEDGQEALKTSLPAVEDSEQASSSVVAKKPRGRPRKYPKPPPSAVAKHTKGRSKTGCRTCRKRKKKCDETKPACLHCQKNNIHCEGYPPKDYWQGGRQKSVKRRAPSFDRPRDLPTLIEGIENDMDWTFFNHFNVHVSRVLSLFTDKSNPFKEILLPMATSHRGLMHSVLCLSGSHLASRDPSKEIGDRQHYHFLAAIRNLRTDPHMAANIAGDSTAIIDDPTVAQTLVLCLKSICAGEVSGEYRPHMDAAKHLIQTQRSPNQEFQSFLFEFFIYHDVCNSIASLDRKSVLMMEDFHLPQFMIQPEAGSLLGVVDGLFGFISKIRQLRDRIRWRRNQNLKPWVNYEILSDAQAIDSGLREWVCAQQRDSPRYIASMLYRQCTWLYLHRTILPSTPNASLYEAVDEGLAYLRQLPTDSSTQSILLMPLFLLGCAAFQPEQRPEIMQAFDGLQAYSNFSNIKYARHIVERVWQMMDDGDEDSWDWETIISSMGWDFLIT